MEVENKGVNRYEVSQYKTSSYNYTVEGTSGSVLYNTCTGATVWLSGADAGIVSAFLANPNNTELQSQRPDIWESLRANGYIVPADVDELSLIRLRLLKSRFSVRHLILTLIPTRACNCRCIYCFEDPDQSTMNQEDCLEVIEFAKNQVTEHRPTNMIIVWYGGEPLLVPETIEFLANGLQKVCNEFTIPLESLLVSNGYLLSKKLAVRLRHAGVSRVQYTLDGPKEIHDQRRVLKTGAPTFERIKQAILISKEVFDLVSVRVHVDRENKDVVLDLLKEDWLRGENLLIRPGWVRDYSELCVDWKADGKAVTADQFRDLEEAFGRFISGFRPNSEDSVKDLLRSIPVKGQYCGADYLGTWAIGPRAAVYRCISALDAGDICGRIMKGKFQPNGRFADWFLRSALDERECLACKLLPLCMGGCPILRRRYPRPSESGICEYWASYLQKRLTSVVERRSSKTVT